MIGDILVSILGSTAYDLIKSIVKKVYGNDDEKLVKQLYTTFEKATKSFTEIYKNVFSTFEGSFLSNHKNWEIIVQSIYYSKDKLTAEQLITNGFGYNGTDIMKITKHFVEILLDEMKKNWELDKILTMKSHLVEVREHTNATKNEFSKTQQSLQSIDQKITKIAQKLSGEMPSENGYGFQIDDPNNIMNSKPYKEGDIITYTLNNGTIMSFMVKGDIVSVEHKLQDGAIAYYDVDFNGNIKNIKYPYPISEYTIEIPNDLIINEQIFNLHLGMKRIIKTLKWGKLVDMVIDKNSCLVDFTISGGAYVNHIEKKITITKPNQQSEIDYLSKPTQT